MDPEREKQLAGSALQEGLSWGSWGLAMAFQCPLGRDSTSCYDSMPGSALSTFGDPSQYSGGTPPSGDCYRCLTNEGMEAQRGYAICPGLL